MFRRKTFLLLAIIAIIIVINIHRRQLLHLYEKNDIRINDEHFGKQYLNASFCKETEEGFVNKYAGLSDIPDAEVTGVECERIAAGNKTAIEEAKVYQKQVKNQQNVTHLLELTRTCKNFISKRKYIMYPVNEEEEKFPIAFSLVLYTDVMRAERLLRAIYRPQNVYCIHIDKKSAPVIHEIMTNIVKCFDNVFIASQTHSVNWGFFSVVLPELTCMKDLLQHPIKWKYFINTCGQEFPLKTNLELVKILTAFNGSNNIEGHSPHFAKGRIEYGYKEEKWDAEKYKKPPFEYPINWLKGAVHIAAVRGYVDFLINSPVGQELIKYVNDTPHASEHLFNPLQYSPHLGVPGSYTGDKKTSQVGSVIRYKVWSSGKKKCFGTYTRSICIISLGDLKQVMKSKNMFVNKFHEDFDPSAYDCLEKHLFSNIKLDVLGVNRLNISYYKNLEFVKHHL